MNLIATIAAFAALAAAPALASAQSGANPQEIDSPRARASSPRAQAQVPAAPATAPELHAAAQCLIGRDPAAADILLATAPYSAEERTEVGHQLRQMQRCVARTQPMNSNVALIRGALAEAVLEARFPAPQPARDPALAVKSLLQLELATTRADAAALAPAYTLAECVVVRGQDLVRALIAAEPASPAASAAFNALSPVFSACVTGNLQLNIDARTLRGVLAEDLLRWSAVQRDGPASTLAAAVPSSPPVQAVVR